MSAVDSASGINLGGISAMCQNRSTVKTNRTTIYIHCCRNLSRCQTHLVCTLLIYLQATRRRICKVVIAVTSDIEVTRTCKRTSTCNLSNSDIGCLVVLHILSGKSKSRPNIKSTIRQIEQIAVIAVKTSIWAIRLHIDSSSKLIALKLQHRAAYVTLRIKLQCSSSI